MVRRASTAAANGWPATGCGRSPTPPPSGSRSGELLVTDGPFTETKDWIAGFDILECDDLDEAIEIAAKHPMARAGRLELRPFWPIDELSAE